MLERCRQHCSCSPSNEIWDFLKVCEHSFHYLLDDTGICTECPGAAGPAMVMVSLFVSIIIVAYLLRVYLTRPPACLKPSSLKLQTFVRAVKVHR